MNSSSVAFFAVLTVCLSMVIAPLIALWRAKKQHPRLERERNERNLRNEKWKIEILDRAEVRQRIS
jgi:hypothetical protein